MEGYYTFSTPAAPAAPAPAGPGSGPSPGPAPAAPVLLLTVFEELESLLARHGKARG
jgi:hypothetical protein